MSIKSDIEKLDKSFIEISHPEAVIDAWYRVKQSIKKHCVECENLDHDTLDCKKGKCQHEWAYFHSAKEHRCIKCNEVQ